MAKSTTVQGSSTSILVERRCCWTRQERTRPSPLRMSDTRTRPAKSCPSCTLESTKLALARRPSPPMPPPPSPSPLPTPSSLEANCNTSLHWLSLQGLSSGRSFAEQTTTPPQDRRLHPSLSFFLSSLINIHIHKT